MLFPASGEICHRYWILLDDILTLVGQSLEEFLIGAGETLSQTEFSNRWLLWGQAEDNLVLKLQHSSTL